MTFVVTWFSALIWLGIAISRAVLGAPPLPSRFPHALLRNPFTARHVKLVSGFPGNAAGIAHIVSVGTAIMGDGLMHWSSGRGERAATECHGKSHLRGCTSRTSLMDLRHGRPPRMEEARRQMGLASGEVRKRSTWTRTRLEAQRSARSRGTWKQATCSEVKVA